MGIVVVVEGQADLLVVVATLRASRGFAGLLDGGEEQGHEDRDNGDHDEQLNERETS